MKLDQNWVFMQREILFVPYEGGKPHNFEIQEDIFTVLDYLKDSLSTTEVLYWTNMEPVVALKEDHNGEWLAWDLLRCSKCPNTSFL